MRPPIRPIAQSSERGFVIVAVLWILVALSTLAMIFSVYLSNSARALGATDIGVESEALVSASLELAAYQLLSADEKARPAQGSFRFRMDDAAVLATFTSEAARVDLNKASKEMLANLFEVLGAEGKAAEEVANRIVGWRTPPKPGAANDEEALYLASGRAYSPRQAPFAHVNELSLVLGVSPAMVERALPYVTVFSKSADVDVLLAPPEVIAALPGMTPEVLNDFLKKRPSLPRDQKAVAAALGPAVKAAGSLPETKAFRVLTTIRFDNGRGTSTEAVILLGRAEVKDKGKDGAKDNTKDNTKDHTKDNNDSAKDKEPYRILSWQDRAESLTRSSRRAGG
ncbi:general secretion pathway protein GspK [Bradyrhizobium sp.]|jgi:general secretion pathway protein K|uniref:general secretion pathway protein GspK n=1 Tax=Bradyrhizobium sp. TaxID=376 RepID=UPI003BAFFC2E